MSKPVRLAFEANLIARGTTLLDYGCGRGDDLKSLAQNEIMCWGWDPVYFPDGSREPADVVNLGYVVNVIEDPVERRDVLSDAWARAGRLLIVSSRLDLEASGLSVDTFSDGCVTQWGTFQKFFSQEELREFLDTTLGVSSIAAAPGIFFVFRDETLQHWFLSQRFQRAVRSPLVRQSDILYEKLAGAGFEPATFGL